MTVRGVRAPTLEDALCAVSLAHVLSPVTGVGDQIDTDDRCERCSPCRVPVLPHDSLKLSTIKHQPVEARKGIGWESAISTTG